MANISGICIIGSILLCGCAQDYQKVEPAPLKPDKVAQVTYHDRNGDGKVDQEKHHFLGMADADWELQDNDYNGKYEKKIRYGVGVFESSVDLPVPTSVRIESKP